MSLKEDIQQPNPGVLIDLYIIDLTPISPGVYYYFYAGLDANYGSLQYDGNVYTPWPVSVEGFEKSGAGVSARPKFIIGNPTGFVSTLMDLYQDLIGSKVTRVRTMSKYLDGEPTADAAANTREMYFVNQKVADNGTVVEFELTSATDFEGKKLPGRIMVANTCIWLYGPLGGAECGWPGTDPSKYFKADGTPTANPSEDVCGKRLTDCQLRFGEEEELPFGAFPALGRSG